MKLPTKDFSSKLKSDEHGLDARAQNIIRNTLDKIAAILFNYKNSNFFRLFLQDWDREVCFKDIFHGVTIPGSADILVFRWVWLSGFIILDKKCHNTDRFVYYIYGKWHKLVQNSQKILWTSGLWSQFIVQWEGYILNFFSLWIPQIKIWCELRAFVSQYDTCAVGMLGGVGFRGWRGGGASWE